MEGSKIFMTKQGNFSKKGVLLGPYLFFSKYEIIDLKFSRTWLIEIKWIVMVYI